MNISILQICLISLFYCFSNISWPFGSMGQWATINRPLVGGLVVGLILGNPVQGTIIGATINAVSYTHLVPNQRIQSSAADVASFVDVYDFVESRLSGEQEQHHDAGNLQQIIAAEIDNYYVDMERALQAPDVDRSLLDSVLFPGSIGICSEFLSRASRCV